MLGLIDGCEVGNADGEELGCFDGIIVGWTVG